MLHVDSLLVSHIAHILVVAHRAVKRAVRDRTRELLKNRFGEPHDVAVERGAGVACAPSAIANGVRDLGSVIDSVATARSVSPAIGGRQAKPARSDIISVGGITRGQTTSWW
jgi:hypothetical protein